MSAPERIDPASTAIVLIDLQNDFLAPDGAYARGGVGSEAIAALPGRLAPVLGAARAAGVPIVSTQFTLTPIRGREPLISAHLREKRPFLRAGDFEPGRRGHDLVDALQPPDVVVQKVAYSAFHASSLPHVLAGLGTRTVIVAGIVTNGGVTSTVRDAHVRGYEALVIGDGCADFDEETHAVALRGLRSVATVSDCAGVLALLEAAG